MANFIKTNNISLLPIQSVGTGLIAISSPVEVTTKFSATVFIHFGRRSTTALTEGVELRVEASTKLTGDGYWFPLTVFKSGTVAATSVTIATTHNAGITNLVDGSGTGFADKPRVYIDDATITNGEWGKIRAILATVGYVLEDATINTHTASFTVYDKAELFVAQLDLTAITRLRLVVDGSKAMQTVVVEAFIVTGDSVA